MQFQGLTFEEARKRLAAYGPNELEEGKRLSPLRIFLSQFLNFLVLILIAAGLISYFLGDKIEALAIFAIVLAAGLLGFFQEYQAEKSLQALKKLITPTAKVIREGRVVEIPVREIVPGDIVFVEAGDIVPADGLLLEGVDLYVDEAVLTGESFPVEKTHRPSSQEDEEKRNILFMGTYVVKGKGYFEVSATGKNTEFGKIAGMLKEVEEKKTPLQKKIEVSSRKLGIIILLLSASIAFVGVLKGHPLYEMFIWGVALAVALIPEALPAVATITLALGVKRMAEKKALIRKLPAVETLGSVTYICTDKTGTLTKNEMTVKSIFVSGKILEVTGVGYEPKGEILWQGQPYAPDKALDLLLKVSLLCNNAELFFDEKERRFKIKGDPTEGALITLAYKAGLNEELRIKNPPLREIPFSSERMRMTTLHHLEGKIYAFTKGALEVLLERCAYLLTEEGLELLTEAKRAEILEVAHEFSKRAYRVLAFAFKEVKDSHLPEEEIEKELIFLGLVGMMDPPREEVKEAIKIAKEAGIKVVMITGDNKETALSVGKEIGLYEGGLVLTGKELRALSERDFEEKVLQVEIYARAMPEDKLKIVKALQKRGQIVAMTGDGVNDAPALKQADIGIAMGITGTEVAKEASAMVLLEENFATIVRAVEEGRTIFANIRKFLTYLMTGNTATVTALTLALFLDLPLPLTAVQILFINLLMDGFPAIALGLEPKEPYIMKVPPRDPKEGLLPKENLIFIFWMGLFMAFLAFSLYYYILWKDGPAKASSIFFASIIIFRLINALNCRSQNYSLFEIGVFSNKWLTLSLFFSFLLMLLAIYTPLNKLFHTQSLHIKDWILILIAGLLIWLVDEFYKFIKRKNSIENKKPLKKYL
jgi:Ca2+-transporting ATPase